MLGRVKAFLEYSLLLCGKWLWMSYPDYHNDMSEIVFKGLAWQHVNCKFTQTKES